jgi:hypothetical protein
MVLLVLLGLLVLPVPTLAVSGLLEVKVALVLTVAVAPAVAVAVAVVAKFVHFATMVLEMAAVAAVAVAKGALVA